MRKILALVAVCALLMAGCSSGASGKQFRQIVYSYTGGVAGFDQSMAITANGTFQIAEKGKPGRTGHIANDDLRALRQLVSSINWANVDAEYIDPRVADAIVEGLSVEVGQSTYRTRVGTGGEPPAELAQLLGELKQIFGRQK